MIKSKKEHFILGIIILLQIGYLCTMFFGFKQGFHSDEVLNFSIANSFDKSDEDNLYTYNTWNDSQLFEKYISVEQEHRFSYNSVIRNSNNDLNPPLHFFVLHFICSLFPGTFSWNYCFVINLISFAFGQIFLYEYVYRSTKDYFASIATILVYGFSLAAMDITIFMRLYAFSIPFCLMFLLFSYVFYEKDLSDKKVYFWLIPIFVSCLCGAYSLHLFLVFAFGITFCYCLIYLCSGKFKKLFSYGFTCLISVIISFLIYPKTVADVGGTVGSISYNTVMFPVKWQIRLYFYFLFREIFGFSVSIFPNGDWKIAIAILLFVVILLIPLMILFRKEKWYIQFIIKLKEYIRDTINKVKNFDLSLIPLVFTIIFMVIIVANRTSVYLMQEYSNRYIFIIYGITCALVMMIIFYILKLLKFKDKVRNISLIAISAVFVISCHLHSNYDYLFRYDQQGISLSNLEDDSNVIVMLDENWKICCYAPLLMNTNSYYATNYSQYKSFVFPEGEFLENPCYISLVNDDILDPQYSLSEAWSDEDGDASKYYIPVEDVIDFYKSFDCVSDIQLVGTDSIQTLPINIYRVYFNN